MPSNSDNIKKRDGEQKYSVLSDDDNPEPMEWLWQGKVLFHQNFIRGGSMPQCHRDTRGLILEGGT